jgi:hypothetical protein
MVCGLSPVTTGPGTHSGCCFLLPGTMQASGKKRDVKKQINEGNGIILFLIL